MDNKQEKLIRIIKIVVSIFAVLFFAFLIYSMFFSEGMDYFWIMFIGGSMFIIGFTIFVVIYGVKAGKEYRKNLMALMPKRRFKYLDSFYYVKIFYHSADETSSRRFIIYHVIQDTDSKKIYAIGESGTNVRFQKVFDNTKLLRIDNIDGISTRKEWKEVNYDDVGSFWIDKELIDYYQNNGEKIMISYFGKKDKIKLSEMYNRNPKYDISLLDKAIFITGYAEFDANN